MSVKRLNDNVEIVKKFCYIGNGLNACSDSEMLVVQELDGSDIKNVEKFYMEGYFHQR